MKKTTDKNARFELAEHMRPSIRISPFFPASFTDLLARPAVSRTVLTDARFWLNKARDMEFYDSGRTAILAVLKERKLKRPDEVVIITTTQGRYISSCVTKTIETVCRWSRQITARTKLALVIHEFGFSCRQPQIALCQKLGVPILEDCAYAVGSREQGADVGTFGDYAVYSLTKHFPVPFGGILAAKDKIISRPAVKTLAAADRKCAMEILQRSASRQKQWAKTRQENWRFFSRRLRSFGIVPYFKLDTWTVPGAFVLRLPKRINGAAVKKRLVAAGVESTEYYHMGGFYFPVHQNLTEWEREYILRNFLNGIAR